MLTWESLGILTKRKGVVTENFRKCFVLCPVTVIIRPEGRLDREEDEDS